MTSAELFNHLQALECKYASFTNKLSLALQYGSSNLECLQNTAFVVKSNLDILKKFYSDGKICTDCDITATTWRIDNICGYVNSPYTTYECFYNFVAGVSPDKYVNSIFTFNDDGTFVLVEQDSTTIIGNYTYDNTTGIIIITSGNFFSPMTLTFSSNCSELIMRYDNSLNSQTAILVMEAVEAQNQNCDWAEYCITEEEAEDLIKICYKKLSSTCNC